MRLSNQHLKAFSKVALTLSQPVAFDAFPAQAIKAVEPLIDCDFYAFDKFALNESRTFVPGRTVVYPEYRGNFRAFEEYLSQHPCFPTVIAAGVDRPVKMSDFTSLARWRHTELYNNFFRSENQNYQLVFLCQFPKFKVGLAFNRSKSDFSEEERKMAELIRPHLAQAHHNSQIYSDLSEALESDGRGFLVVDLNGKIRCATSNAKRYLERYAGPIKSQMLPNPVRDWVRVQSDRFAVPEFTLQNVLRLHRENGRLTIQVLTVTADGESRLSLTEETSPLAASSLEGLGLTKREAEVLFWVTQGKRNSEIGLILGTKERTIYKHLERVFAKLNVETRTAAANIVFERFHKSAVCRSR
jgi:DNA-binding CsgD family transcriptional regulator